MGYTCVLCIIIISFCHESMANISLTVYRNNTHKRYDTSITINYDEGEFVRIYCTAEGQKLSWDTEHTSSMNDIVFQGALQKSYDRTEKVCHAANTELSISVKFVRNLTELEKSLAKPNTFKIILICLGGALGAAVILLSGYALFRCCRKKPREETPTYAQIDLTMKKPKQEVPHYCEVGIVGIDNVSCQVDETDKAVIIDSITHSDNSDVKTVKVDMTAIQGIRNSNSQLKTDSNAAKSDSSMACVNAGEVDSYDNHNSAAQPQEVYPRSVKINQNNGNNDVLFKQNNVNAELKKRLTLGKLGSSSDC